MPHGKYASYHGISELKMVKIELGMVAITCNPRTQEVDAGG
jgi:hypothetical protein